MKIHEYQGKQLLAAAGVTVPRGIVASTPDEAAAAFTELGGEIAVNDWVPPTRARSERLHFGIQ